MHDTCNRVALSVALIVLTLPVPAQQKPAETPPTPVKMASVTRETLNVEVTAVGTLRADETVMIRPEIAGRVATIHFKEGQAVSEGDPLVTLDQGEYQAQLAGSAAQIGLEEISYRRLQDLQRKNLTSPQSLDEAKARLDAARAGQTLAQVRLDKTVIRAPFAGTAGSAPGQSWGLC
jgi:membrane fusion protein (multidrug efflux system)